MPHSLHTNRLIDEASPYLRQHAHNPVDWFPWDQEALNRAKSEDKPIFLSIGYSACHWCHVMERESFEDEQTATLLNEHFVSIKVDREERPDLDAVYMEAVQMMTGQGGWPMSVFLTPEGEPFYAGTYFPPVRRHGLPGFRDVLEAVAVAYNDRRSEVASQARLVAETLQRSGALQAGESELDVAVLEQAEKGLRRSYDRGNGGFERQPKFPQPMVLDFLMRRYAATGDADTMAMVDVTLEKMARGGIYDQLGGGFHRYSVDATWLVPHFEKMLYDNAQLLRAYLGAYQVTGKPLYRQVVEQTVAYVLREMTSPDGGFYSTQDADSEGEEGRYYVWTPAEIEAVLGAERGRIVAAYYGVTEDGNFEGRSILHVPASAAEVAGRLGLSADRVEAVVAESRPLLLTARERREHPGRDEKILTEWNGLMIHALAEVGAALDHAEALQAAQAVARFVLTQMRQPGGRLCRSHKDGKARIPAYLEDYASLVRCLVALYEADFDPRWVEDACRIADGMLSLFLDADRGGFYQTAADQPALVARRKEVVDAALPSGNALAAEALLRLSALTGDAGYWEHAERTLALVSDLAGGQPHAFGRSLAAIDLLLGPEREIAIIGDPSGQRTRELLRLVRRRYLPNTVVAVKPPDQGDSPLALFKGRKPIDGEVVAYVCEDYVCQAPVTEPEEFAALL
ncbi:MAG: thioredoxin domain-containing protein [Anaerolineae bacterium]